MQPTWYIIKGDTINSSFYSKALCQSTHETRVSTRIAQLPKGLNCRKRL